jgi:hypothetical protein
VGHCLRLVCFRRGMRVGVSGVNAYFQLRKPISTTIPLSVWARTRRSIFSEGLIRIAV